MTIRKFLDIIILSILALVLLAVNQSHAANQMVKSSGTGDSTGADWTNARGWSQVTSTNLTRGDTLWFADGTYSGYKQFNKAVSSTTPIVLMKATVANHGSAVGWSDALGDGQAVFTSSASFVLNFSTGYWELNGQAGTDSTGYGFKVTSTSTGNYQLINIGAGGNNITIKYVDVAGTGEDTGTASQSCIYAVSATDSIRYLKVQNCYIHDINQVHFYLMQVTNSLVENCLIMRRHTAGTSPHGEAFSINRSGLAAQDTIRNNTIVDVLGTSVICLLVTGTTDERAGGFVIYNNLFYCTNKTRYMTSNGVIGTTTGHPIDNSKIYNNIFTNLTFQGGYGLWLIDGSISNEAKNNLFYGCGAVKTTGITTHDYNASESASDSIGVEAHNVVLTADPFANSTGYDFALKSGAQVIDTGDSTDVTWTTDLAGNDRVQGANIDIGAFEYYTDPTPPSDLTNTVNLPKHSVHTFTDNSSDEEGFQIMINGVVVDSLAANAETFSIDNQSPGTAYNVQIRAYKGDYLSGATVVNFTAPRYRLGRVR